MSLSIRSLRPSRAPRVPHRILAVAVGSLPLLVLASLPFVASCGKEEAAAQRMEAPVVVSTLPLAAVETAGTVDGVGTVQSEREAVLSGKVMGTVVEIRKSAGDPIRRGEVLIVVDNREVTGQIAQAEGALAQARAAAVLAETNFHRFEALRQRGAASQLELDQARYQHETAQGAVKQAEGAVTTANSYKSYAEIPAPFDGRVVDRMIEVGDMAAPGRPLMRIEDPRRLRLHVTLPEGDLAAAVPGAKVGVHIPALGGRGLTGTVAEVVPAVDPATRSALVKIDLPDDPDLRSGLYGRAVFQTGTRRTLRVPRAAVKTRGGLSGVYVAEDGRATFRLVTLAEAASADDTVEVLSGLSEGDAIIVSPTTALEEGTPVEVRS